ncbi:putative nucleoside-diphosphate-sugar epimerase [hydrocarbon metagenome]|uniref:Putative nucleoside-diphosphate-sugar epimerase n=1 Tax=hydrocarbon metagenome TaxID=938273 RepID=A0A0W8FXX9_9ZZZZ
MKNILVTGATGYIGGRLITRLIDKGYNVTCLVRDKRRVLGRWPEAKVVEGDVHKFDSLTTALKDIDIAYYLIHSMSSGEHNFVDLDEKAAENFSLKAKTAGVKRIIYLGGLGSKSDELSPHLRSRQATGEKLRSSGISVTEFRAGMIVGSGSLSFEMVRYLTERVPIMICPKWVSTKTQPIAIRDVLRYLIDTIEKPESENMILEIGSPDILTYADLMLTYAKIRGLKRYMINVPFLTPRLSSYWVDLVTPIPSNIARPIIEGLKNESVCSDDRARKIFPFEPISYEDAVTFALQRQKKGNVETIWSGSISSINSSNVINLDLLHREGMIIEKRERVINAPAHKVFEIVSKLGGKNGWYANFLWQTRGVIDRVFGGVGMRRGRRDKEKLMVGDPLDFWRVEAVETNQLIRLRAEMKLPGRAWLQFSLRQIDPGKSILTQIAFFEPKGLFGVIYWYSIYFVHKLVFSGMINDIKSKSESTLT